MSRPTQLKRRLLREAVDENLSTIEGRPAPRRPPPRPSRVPARWPRLAAAALLAAAATALLFVAAARLGPESNSEVNTAETATAGVAQEPANGAPAEDPASQLTFPAPRPIDPGVFSFEVRRITLDPGHGGEDHGTTSGELSEKDLTLDIARRLRDDLAKNYEVLLTRDSDVTLNLRERAELANESKSDLFVSIHINWLSTRQVRGVETYYLGPTEDPELTALARRENRQSGFSLVEMRGILDRIYTDFLQVQSHSFARRIQRSLFASLLSVNPELRDRGVKTAPFVVLVSAEMPAILAEVSCLSNRQEAELLTRPLYREHIAQALARGIRRYADDVNQTEDKES